MEKLTIPARVSLTEDDLWTMICALEEYGASGHPVGNAIFSAGVQRLGESWIEFKNFGFVQAANDPDSGGLSGSVSLNGEKDQRHSIVLGSRRYLERHKVACWSEESLPSDESAIIVHVAVDGVYAGAISLVVSQVVTV